MELTEKHLTLARAIANGYPRNVLTRCDFQSLAYFGLAVAFSRYDPESAASFETYARIRIHGTIKDYLRKTDTLGKRRSRAIKRGDVVNEGGGLVPLNKVILVAPGPDPEQQAMLSLLTDLLMPAVAALPRREQQMIRRIDLGGEKSAAVARDLGITVHSIAGYRARAFQKLRNVAKGWAA